MDKVQAFLDRAAVVMRSAVTYIVLAMSVVQTVILAVGDDIPEVAQYGAHVLAFLGGVVAVIRRVTPVDAEDRGVLPSEV